MKNVEVFEKIFWEVGAKHNLTKWWDIFDSEVFEEVREGIRQYFGVELASEVEGYLDWTDEMYWEL